MTGIIYITGGATNTVQWAEPYDPTIWSVPGVDYACGYDPRFVYVWCHRSGGKSKDRKRRLKAHLKYAP